MRTRVALIAVLLCALPSPGAAKPTTHRVDAAGGPVGPTWRWEPAELEIARKDKVVWHNETSSRHHVAFYEGPLAGKTLHVPSGEKAKQRFKKRGVYRYRCTLPQHSEIVGGVCVGQCAEIVVE